MQLTSQNYDPLNYRESLCLALFSQLKSDTNGYSQIRTSTFVNTVAQDPVPAVAD
jgi:hypothetical protein